MVGKFRPKKTLIEWCSCCDAITVNSGMPDTGTFYYANGQEYKPIKFADHDGFGDNCVVVFALCPKCDKLKGVIDT